MNLFQKLMESDPEYQKNKKKNQEEQAEFHKKNPQMMDLLTETDEHRLSMILWQKIWEQELVLEFRNIYPHRTQDAIFGVVKAYQ